MGEGEATQSKKTRSAVLHTLGALLMWGSVLLALINLHYMVLWPEWFGIIFGACFILALAGAWLKKRHCLRCQI